MLDHAIFFFFGTVSLAAAINVLWQKKAVYSALSLVLCLGALAMLYLQLHAQFVAILQIVIYAGAIMVLFLFVIMFLDPHADAPQPRARLLAYLSLPLGLLFLLAALAFVWPGRPGMTAAEAPQAAQLGHIEQVGQQLLTRHVVALEAIGILILVAALGAVILAKRKL